MILCKCWLKTLLESADLLAFVISSGGFWYVVIYALCLYELEHISCMRSADLHFVGALRCITRLNRYFAIKLWFFEEITFFFVKWECSVYDTWNDSKKISIIQFGKDHLSTKLPFSLYTFFRKVGNLWVA